MISPLTGNLAAGDFDITGIGELAFTDEAADPTADGRMRRSGDVVMLRMQDARTNTTVRPWAIWADTTGTPAASIGIGMVFRAESGDENPSDFGAVDFVASDVGAGTEDTYMSALLRVAGRALDEKYRWSSTAGDGFAVLYTHAVTADRTVTIPDLTFTMGAQPTRSTQDVATSETTTSTSYTDLTTSGPAVTLSPGRATDQIILLGCQMSNSAADRIRMSVAIAGAGAADADAVEVSGAAGTMVRATAHVMATAVANASTHTAKYKVSAGTGTFVDRRISALTVT